MAVVISTVRTPGPSRIAAPSVPRPPAPRRPVRCGLAPAIRRRRAVVVLAVVTLVVAGLWYALGARAGAPLPGAGRAATISAFPVAARSWVVRPGDTVWSIVAASGYRGDPRPVVDRLSDQLGGRPLQPGQRLVLP